MLSNHAPQAHAPAQYSAHYEVVCLIIIRVALEAQRYNVLGDPSRSPNTLLLIGAFGTKAPDTLKPNGAAIIHFWASSRRPIIHVASGPFRGPCAIKVFSL